MQTTEMFTFVCLIGDLLYWHFHKTCHIVFIVHVFNLTFMLRGNLQEFPEYANVTLLDMFKEILEEFPAAFEAAKKRKEINSRYFWWEVGLSAAMSVVTKLCVFNVTSGHLQLCLWPPRQLFYAKPRCSPKLSKVFLCVTRGKIKTKQK